jgi:hypothetical protein
VPQADRFAVQALPTDDVGDGLIQLGRLLTNAAIVSDPKRRAVAPLRRLWVLGAQHRDEG